MRGRREKVKKKDKKSYTLFVFQNHGDRKCHSLAFHSYKKASFYHGTGCLDVLPKKEHILYCAVHFKYRAGHMTTLEKNENFSACCAEDT